MVSLICFDICEASGRQQLQKKASFTICEIELYVFVFNVGGSLDVYWRIPEHVLGRIAVAVSHETVIE